MKARILGAVAVGLVLGAVTAALGDDPPPNNMKCTINAGAGCGSGCEGYCTNPSVSCCEVTPVKYDMCVGPVEGENCPPKPNVICANVKTFYGGLCDAQGKCPQGYPGAVVNRTTIGC